MCRVSVVQVHTDVTIFSDVGARDQVFERSDVADAFFDPPVGVHHPLDLFRAGALQAVLLELRAVGVVRVAHELAQALVGGLQRLVHARVLLLRAQVLDGPLQALHVVARRQGLQQPLVTRAGSLHQGRLLGGHLGFWGLGRHLPGRLLDGLGVVLQRRLLGLAQVVPVPGLAVERSEGAVRVVEQLLQSAQRLLLGLGQRRALVERLVLDRLQFSEPVTRRVEERLGLRRGGQRAVVLLGGDLVDPGLHALGGRRHPGLGGRRCGLGLGQLGVQLVDDRGHLAGLRHLREAQQRGLVDGRQAVELVEHGPGLGAQHLCRLGHELLAVARHGRVLELLDPAVQLGLHALGRGLGAEGVPLELVVLDGVALATAVLFHPPICGDRLVDLPVRVNLGAAGACALRCSAAERTVHALEVLFLLCDSVFLRHVAAHHVDATLRVRSVGVLVARDSEAAPFLLQRRCPFDQGLLRFWLVISHRLGVLRTQVVQIFLDVALTPILGLALRAACEVLIPLCAGDLLVELGRADGVCVGALLSGRVQPLALQARGLQAQVPCLLQRGRRRARLAQLAGLAVGHALLVDDRLVGDVEPAAQVLLQPRHARHERLGVRLGLGQLRGVLTHHLAAHVLHQRHGVEVAALTLLAAAGADHTVVAAAVAGTVAPAQLGDLLGRELLGRLHPLGHHEAVAGGHLDARVLPELVAVLLLGDEAGLDRRIFLFGTADQLGGLALVLGLVALGVGLRRGDREGGLVLAAHHLGFGHGVVERVHAELGVLAGSVLFLRRDGLGRLLVGLEHLVHVRAEVLLHGLAELTLDEAGLLRAGAARELAAGPVLHDTVDLVDLTGGVVRAALVRVQQVLAQHVDAPALRRVVVGQLVQRGVELLAAVLAGLGIGHPTVQLLEHRRGLIAEETAQVAVDAFRYGLALHHRLERQAHGLAQVLHGFRVLERVRARVLQDRRHHVFDRLAQAGEILGLLGALDRVLGLLGGLLGPHVGVSGHGLGLVAGALAQLLGLGQRGHALLSGLVAQVVHPLADLLALLRRQPGTVQQLLAQLLGVLEAGLVRLRQLGLDPLGVRRQVDGRQAAGHPLRGGVHRAGVAVREALERLGHRFGRTAHRCTRAVGSALDGLARRARAVRHLPQLVHAGERQRAHGAAGCGLLQALGVQILAQGLLLDRLARSAQRRVLGDRRRCTAQGLAHGIAGQPRPGQPRHHGLHAGRGQPAQHVLAQGDVLASLALALHEVARFERGHHACAGQGRRQCAAAGQHRGAHRGAGRRQHLASQPSGVVGRVTQAVDVLVGAHARRCSGGSGCVLVRRLEAALSEVVGAQLLRHGAGQGVELRTRTVRAGPQALGELAVTVDGGQCSRGRTPAGRQVRRGQRVDLVEDVSHQRAPLRGSNSVLLALPMLMTGEPPWRSNTLTGVRAPFAWTYWFGAKVCFSMPVIL